MSGYRYEITVVDGVIGKLCNQCGVWHPKTAYYVGLRGGKERWRCKEAHKVVYNNYMESVKAKGEYDQHLAKYQAYTRRHIAKYKAEDIKGYKMRTMLSNATKRAKNKGLLFSISVDDFPDWRGQTHCPVMPWVKFRWDNKQQSADSPTIDKIRDDLGYVPGNVRLICWRANDLKRNGTIQEFEALYRDALLRDK